MTCLIRKKIVKPPSPPLHQAFRRRLWHFVRVLCLLYFVTAVGCAALQRKLIYYPTHPTSADLDRFAAQHGLERWKNAAGENIGWVRRAPTQPAHGQVLITHGNGGCAIDRFDFAEPLRQTASRDVFILEYPGYGDRAGHATQTSLFQAADDAFRSLPKSVPTYLIGESLGTGVAAYLAGAHSNEVSGVLLFAPYNSLVDVAQHHVKILPASLILRDRFESQEYLKSYGGPLAIIVGGRDKVVPEEFGRRLYDDYAGPKRLWVAPQAGHNHIHAHSGSYWSEIISFWQSNTVQPVERTTAAEN